MNISILTCISKEVLCYWSEDFQIKVNTWILQKCSKHSYTVFDKINCGNFNNYLYIKLNIDYLTWDYIKNIAFETKLDEYFIYDALCKLYLKTYYK